MKRPLILSLLLLGTVSALHLSNDFPKLESLETVADLSQDLEGSGEQEGKLAPTEKVVQSEEEEVESFGYEDALEDEEDTEKDLQCPREEDTVHLLGSPGCKTCRYLLVRNLRTFRKAQNICSRCYRGNLASIHSFGSNYRIQLVTSRINQAQVWIGGILKGWFRCRRFRWTDGSRWDFGFWASGQPGNGRGRCVALCTRGGRWRRNRCKRRLPFICSF
ncbi:proteoglycan 3 [Loxodonta africana]|uniref:proteoglycan 3 n=1 Tax=Loxodonta africana TaxID=9785 RepID=UPI0030CBCA8D